MSVIEVGIAIDAVTFRLQVILYTHSHSRVLIFEDIKPENILLIFDENRPVQSSLQLCDFGLAAKFEGDEMLKDPCGSPVRVSTLR